LKLVNRKLKLLACFDNIHSLRNSWLEEMIALITDTEDRIKTSDKIDIFKVVNQDFALKQMGNWEMNLKSQINALFHFYLIE
jgi:hypothetical protein